MLTEVCVDSVDGIRVAAAAGADRVELCTALEVGGVTPSAGLIEAAVAAAGPMPVHVLVRPRPGDFGYCAAECAVMGRDIAVAADAGAAGVVVGVLDDDRRVAAAPTATLVELARRSRLSVTFHRAFDLTRDPVEALSTLRDLGIDRILTSGQADTALEGAALLADLVRRSPDGPVILAGGGVRADTVAALIAATGVVEVHFSARSAVAPTAARSPGVRMGSADDGRGRSATDAALVAATVAAARAGAASGAGAGA